ncbi:hypothetical protein HpNP141_14650 [Helicobacter pylori]
MLKVRTKKDFLKDFNESISYPGVLKKAMLQALLIASKSKNHSNKNIATMP